MSELRMNTSTTKTRNNNNSNSNSKSSNSNSSKNYDDATTMRNGSGSGNGNGNGNDSNITATTTATTATTKTTKTTTTTTTTSTEDPSVLWERLQESQRQRLELMEEEKIKLQNEIDSLIAVLATPSDNDIIEIDAGGKIIRALRSTLCLVAPDTTMFSCMFSGRAGEDNTLIRDDHGRVFLDHDPELIEIIINFLRTRKIEKQSKPVRSPKVPEGPRRKEGRIRISFTLFWID
jgi:hypothetical protein